MMFTHKGRLINSMGWASKTLPVQFPHFKGRIENIGNFFPATLNIEIQDKWIDPPIEKFDFYIKDLCWTPGIVESFGFIKARMKFLFGIKNECDVLIYRPFGSKNLSKTNLIEVIAPFIRDLPNLSDQSCLVEVAHR